MATSHHGGASNQPPNDIMKRFIEQVEKRAPREYAAGRLGAHDEGSLALAVGVKNNKVIVDFGKPVEWIGMTAQDAVALASMLIDKARQVTTDPLTVEIGKPTR